MGLVLIAMSIRVVVGLVLECVFIVGGEVAVAIWALAGWGGDLDKVPKAIGQETSPAQVCRQTKRFLKISSFPFQSLVGFFPIPGALAGRGLVYSNAINARGL